MPAFRIEPKDGTVLQNRPAELSASGLGTAAKPQHYNGTTVGIVLGDLLRTAGERQDAVALDVDASANTPRTRTLDVGSLRHNGERRVEVEAHAEVVRPAVCGGHVVDDDQPSAPCADPKPSPIY